MKTLTQFKKTLQTQKPYLAKKYGITEIGVFGSYVRNEQRPDSDLDILIELGSQAHFDLFDLVNLEDDLSHLLGVPVDIAIKQNLRKRIGQRILSEVIPI